MAEWSNSNSFGNGDSMCAKEIWRTFPWIFRQACAAAQMER